MKLFLLLISLLLVSVSNFAQPGKNLIDEGLEKHGSIGGKDIVDTSVEIAVEGRFSLVSGKGNFGGSGKIKGLTIIQW